MVFADGGEARDRRMAMYAFDGTSWDLAYAADVPDDVIFVDMLESDDSDRLLMFRRDHVDWLDPDGWTRTTLVSGPSVYNVPPLDVPQVEIARDVNGDALGDLVLADFDGYWIWMQDDARNPNWVGPVKLKATPTAIARFRSASYRPREIYELDYDGDGRNDLAFWEDEQFLVYRGERRELRHRTGGARTAHRVQFGRRHDFHRRRGRALQMRAGRPAHRTSQFTPTGRRKRSSSSSVLKRPVASVPSSNCSARCLLCRWRSTICSSIVPSATSR